jgi:hypothetical protein
VGAKSLYHSEMADHDEANRLITAFMRLVRRCVILRREAHGKGLCQFEFASVAGREDDSPDKEHTA